MKILQENSRDCNICMCVHNFWDNHRNGMNNVDVHNNAEDKAQAPFSNVSHYYHQIKGLGYL